MEVPEVHIDRSLRSQISKLDEYAAGRFGQRLSLIEPAQLRQGAHVPEAGAGGFQRLARCAEEVCGLIVDMHSRFELTQRIACISLAPQRHGLRLVIPQVVCDLFSDLTDMQ